MLVCNGTVCNSNHKLDIKLKFKNVKDRRLHVQDCFGLAKNDANPLKNSRIYLQDIQRASEILFSI